MPPISTPRQRAPAPAARTPAIRCRACAAAALRPGRAARRRGARRPGARSSAALATAPPLASGIENSAMRCWLRGRRADQRLAGRVLQQHDGVLEVEQDARRARHRFQQAAALALLAREGLADFRHQHQVAHFLGQALLHRIDGRRRREGRRRRRCRRRRPGRCRGGPRHFSTWRAACGQQLVGGVRFEAAQRAPPRPPAFGSSRVGGQQVGQRARCGSADGRASRRSLGSWWYSTESARKESSCQRSISQAPASAWVICRVRCSTAHRSSSSRAVKLKRVFLGRRGQQGQAADVVQQAGQVGFFGLRIVHAARHVARQHGGGERILPERAQVGRAGIREAVEGLEHRFADHQGLDHVGAQRHHGCSRSGWRPPRW